VQEALGDRVKPGHDVVMEAASTTPPPETRHSIFEIVRATSGRVNREIQQKCRLG